MRVTPSESLRHGLASNAIARALLLSLLLHFVLIAGMEAGRGLGWWDHTLLPKSASSLVEEVIRTAEQRRQMQPPQQEPPETQMVFIEVDPTQAAVEAPPEAKHYSTHNTKAANPDIRLQTEMVKIDGQQDKVPRTFESLKPEPPTQPKNLEPQQAEAELAENQTPPQLQPEQPQLEPPPETPQPERKPEEGDLVVAKAMPPQRPQQQPPPRTRPRTLAEAKAQKGIIEGPRMKQEGGVRRHALASNLDVKATPFGAYDAAFIAAVQARWYTLLDSRDFVGNQSGKVVVEFRLTRDGRIVDLRVAESEVSETLSWLCQRAVIDPSPYPPFPMDLRRMLRNDYRDVRFTFYYNR